MAPHNWHFSGVVALFLAMPQPAAGCGPGEGLPNALEISGRAETLFKQRALPEEGAAGLTGRGRSSLRRAFPISLWFPPISAKANRWANSILKYQLR